MQFLFNTRKLFSDAGLINSNCVVEAEKMHYCFGRDDIYRHDGNDKQSIADEKVKNFIFRLTEQQPVRCLFRPAQRGTQRNLLLLPVW